MRVSTLMSAVMLALSVVIIAAFYGSCPAPSGRALSAAEMEATFGDDVTLYCFKAIPCASGVSSGGGQCTWCADNINARTVCCSNPVGGACGYTTNVFPCAGKFMTATQSGQSGSCDSCTWGGKGTADGTCATIQNAVGTVGC